MTAVTRDIQCSGSGSSYIRIDFPLPETDLH